MRAEEGSKHCQEQLTQTLIVCLLKTRIEKVIHDFAKSNNIELNKWPDLLGGSRGDVYVAEMTITDLTYTDTGTFTCTYNGTTDISSIDNSTKVTIRFSVT